MISIVCSFHTLKHFTIQFLYRKLTVKYSLFTLKGTRDAKTGRGTGDAFFIFYFSLPTHYSSLTTASFSHSPLHPFSHSNLLSITFSPLLTR